MENDIEDKLLEKYEYKEQPKLPFLIVGRYGQASLFIKPEKELKTLLIKPVGGDYLFRVGFDEKKPNELFFIDPPGGPMIQLGTKLESLRFILLPGYEEKIIAMSTEENGTIHAPEELQDAILGSSKITSIQACRSEQLKGYYITTYETSNDSNTL